jgi:hypothetical protein
MREGVCVCARVCARVCAHVCVRLRTRAPVCMRVYLYLLRILYSTATLSSVFRPSVGVYAWPAHVNVCTRAFTHCVFLGAVETAARRINLPSAEPCGETCSACADSAAATISVSAAVQQEFIVCLGCVQKGDTALDQLSVRLRRIHHNKRRVYQHSNVKKV